MPKRTAWKANRAASVALWTGLSFDDYLQAKLLEERPGIDGLVAASQTFFVFLEGDPVKAQARINRGELAWWTLPNARNAFWRPLSVFTHWRDQQIWPEQTPLMHLHSCGQWLQLPSESLLFLPPLWRWAIWLLVLLLLAGLYKLFLPLLHSDARARFWASEMPLALLLASLALPANRLLFWVGLGDLKVTRSDLSSLIVEKPAGFLSGYDWVFRAEWHPLQLQQEIELERVIITIQGQTRDRRPNRVQFRFKQALEVEQAHWLVWQHGRFERWQLPAVGQTRWYRSTLR